MKRRTKILVVLLCIAAGLFLLTRFVVKPHVVFGESMAPTLRTWDVCFMARSYRYEARRDEVVMFRTADDPPLYYIKRVVALPGETIAVERGVVILNGKPMAEPYSTANSLWDMPPTVVPAGRVFVIGDNRAEEGGATWHGLVATRLVTGRLVWHWRWKL